MFHYICCLFGLVPIICCIDYAFLSFPWMEIKPEIFLLFFIHFVRFTAELHLLPCDRAILTKVIQTKAELGRWENRPNSLDKLACLIISGKKLEIIWSHIIKSSFSWKNTNGFNKLECLSLVSLSSLV
jgi:hypothetical protein